MLIRDIIVQPYNNILMKIEKKKCGINILILNLLSHLKMSALNNLILQDKRKRNNIKGLNIFEKN